LSKVAPDYDYSDYWITGECTIPMRFTFECDNPVRTPCLTRRAYAAMKEKEAILPLFKERGVLKHLLRAPWSVLCLLSIPFLLTPHSDGDVLITNDGKKWEGDVTEEGGTYVLELSSGGKIRFPRQMVKEVKKEEPQSGEPKKRPKRQRPFLCTESMKERMFLQNAKTEARGLLGLAGIGRDVQISEELTITGVPVGYMGDCLERLRLELKVKGVEDPKSPRDRARMVVSLCMRRLRSGMNDGRFRADPVPEARDVIRSVERATSRRCVPPDDLLFAELLLKLSETPPGLSPWVSPRWLLDRFDPSVQVNNSTAQTVAEDMVWMCALRLCDDESLAAMADARTLLQAAILEEFGFEVGDPASLDRAAKETAVSKAKDACKEFRRVWDVNSTKSRAE